MNDKRAIATHRAGDPERHFAIYCDESGIHGRSKFYGFGSLWMPWERRGDFQALWRKLHEAHPSPSEVKWTKVKPMTLPFFKALIDEFFRRKWLMFHCVVIAKRDVDMKYHGKDWDLARRKHFTMLLANKLRRFAAPGKKYRIRVDPIHSRYSKADEAAEAILTRILDQAPSLKGRRIIQSLNTVDSREVPGVQLSDLLVGAVVAAREGRVRGPAKQQLLAHIACHLGWEHLRFDTFPAARKFNVWRFWDPTTGERRPETTRRAITHH